MPETTKDAELTTVNKEGKTPAVLSGAEDCLTGKTALSLSVSVTSGVGKSTLMVPDMGGVAEGKPVYITKPVGIVGAKLKEFLAGDPDGTPAVPARATLPPAVSGLIEDTTISCEAFYYSKDTILIMFDLRFETGAISSLIGADIGSLFDLTGASLRVLKCSKENYPILEKYAAELSE